MRSVVAVLMRSGVPAALVSAFLAVALVPALHAQSPGHARAEPNDQRTPAGRLVAGELHVELEAVEAEWYPRGPHGPPIVTPAFAEVGRPPQVPGPLIRAPAGTPIRVTIRNTLERRIIIRGLLDRATMPAVERPPGAGALPAFVFGDSLVVDPGETQEARFTPGEEVSSFYFGRTVRTGSGDPPFLFNPGIAEGSFMGALVVDPPGVEPPPAERVLMITQWGPARTFKMLMNGQSWPFTERLEYGIGDTVRWRVINATLVEHPMHLHGFYFEVEALGDAHADTVYSPTARPLAVTQMLREFSSMRMRWVPEEAGNWLFHCHLVRHMNEEQLFPSEREAAVESVAEHTHHAEGMAGLITGITVRRPLDGEAPAETPVRRIDLWTGQRLEVYDGQPELGFVVQEGSVPPPADSTRVPGSPLVLTRGEPTDIVVHNRLDFPLSVHWHGLELRSEHDGVGHWSGYPGATRPPVAPGDTAHFVITPRRAGTFMYHVHGEPGYELAQGLYGPFLVLEPGEAFDPENDRVFVLAARGARLDPAPAINGHTLPEAQQFEPGRTYRLRFLQISPDEFKRVRLLKDGEPVLWEPIARDGADLPESLRAPLPASFGIGVGEIRDMAWTPAEPGLYVLEVTTAFFPAIGGEVVQRVAFAVGDVDREDLVVRQGPDLPIVALTLEERRRYVGTFSGRPVNAPPNAPELVLRVVEDGDRLRADFFGRIEMLLPLGEHAFQPVRDLDGLTHTVGRRYHFVAADGVVDRLDVEVDGTIVASLRRAPEAPGAGIAPVAPPTGEREADRASILAALERVEPGGTVQFAQGIYLIGGVIRVPADEITPAGPSRRHRDSRM